MASSAFAGVESDWNACRANEPVFRLARFTTSSVRLVEPERLHVVPLWSSPRKASCGLVQSKGVPFESFVLEDAAALGHSSQIALGQRWSHAGCEEFIFCLVVMLKAVRLFEGRDAHDLTPFEADHARLDYFVWLESWPA